MNPGRNMYMKWITVALTVFVEVLAHAGTNNLDVVNTARRQIGVTVGYDYPVTGHYRIR